MTKYIQKVIPETFTTDYVKLSPEELRKKAFEEYRTLHFGKEVINEDLKIMVKFEREGARKTTYSPPTYSKKMCLIPILDQLVKYAKYNNWGDRKNNDADFVIGYLNFKVKCRIDGKLEHIHLVIRVRNTGEFHYVMEVNKIKNR